MRFFGHIILSDALEVVKPVDPLIELRGSASGSPVELPEDGFLSLQLVDFLARDVRSLHHPTGVVVMKVAMHEGLEDPGLHCVKPSVLGRAGGRLEIVVSA